jgi:hypothetical protein
VIANACGRRFFTRSGSLRGIFSVHRLGRF